MNQPIFEIDYTENDVINFNDTCLRTSSTKLCQTNRSAYRAKFCADNVSNSVQNLVQGMQDIREIVRIRNIDIDLPVDQVIYP